MEHETDYQRARRQRLDVKKHGITGSTPKEAAANAKKHALAKKIGKNDSSNKYNIVRKPGYRYSLEENK